MLVGPTECARRMAARVYGSDVEGKYIMPMGAGEIEKMIKDAIPDAEVRIDDLRGDGDHYAAFIISTSFKGKTRVLQDLMVYAALQGRMGNELHALALHTSAPEDS